MQPDPQPLDYHSIQPAKRVRARLWLSHMLTAAALCLVALYVDSELRFDRGEARRVQQIEVGLAAYGSTCALVSLARGALTRADKVMIFVCLMLFAFTASVALFMPRVIHN